MLIDETVVPALKGTTWGQMVAVPRGGEPLVSPPQCGLFLSQTDALQKGLAMRSSKGAAIGVELAILDPRPDVKTLFDGCRTFSLNVQGGRSSIEMRPLDFDNLPDGALGILQHCMTSRAGETIEWDIAMIVGYRRGVLVEAEYTPGPRGGDFESKFAAGIGEVYRQQVAKLDAS